MWSAVAVVFIVPAAVSAYLLYRCYPWLKYDLEYLCALVHMLLTLKRMLWKKILPVDLFEQQAKRYLKKTFLIYQDNQYSFEYVDKQMNKVAHTALSVGIKTGDTVAVMCFNEPAFLWTVFGLAKIGVQPALLNTNLTSTSLLHCFTASEAKMLIVGQGDELLTAVKEIQSELTDLGCTVYVQGHHGNLPALPVGMLSFDEQFDNADDSPIPKSVRNGIRPEDALCYIYTSGTTGLPKAAVFSHKKWLKATVLNVPYNVSEEDIVYSVLPLYHSAAFAIALGSAVRQGSTLVLRRKFSASSFWDDCRKHEVTMVQYIGELCRYLLARPSSPDDKHHRVRLAFGNGLRSDIWAEFQQRFGLSIISELYTATESNGGLMNIQNKTGSVGRMSPFLQRLQPCHFIKCDVVTTQPLRDDNGLCIPVTQPGEPCMMVWAIKRDHEYDGYKGNKQLTEAKVVHDVKVKGDRCFNTGDLFIFDKDYFVYFQDRIGDTFRWKGENVSTLEVANVITRLPWVEDVTVYGAAVPGHDGRAGMAAIILRANEDLCSTKLSELYRRCADILPAYAQPKFLRFPQQLELTSTMKHMKVKLMKEGIAPSACGGDSLFYANIANGTFSPLTEEAYELVVKGSVRL